MKSWKITWINSVGLHSTVVEFASLSSLLQSLPLSRFEINEWEVIKIELYEREHE